MRKITPLPGSGVYEWPRDEETKTTCPACKGSTHKSITPMGPTSYRVVQCDYCLGAGMVTARKSSAWKMRAVVG